MDRLMMGRMRPRLVALTALLVVLGCGRPTEDTSPPPTPAEVASPIPAPEAEPDEAASKPVKPPPGPGGEFAESRKLRGSDEEGFYRFEGDAFTTDLELHVTIGDEGSGAELRHPGSEGLLDDGPVQCINEFQQGDSLAAQILDHGEVADGRRLLEVWVSCRLGEDIVSVESVVWLVLDDGKKLELLWSGAADYHGSWVCATYDQLEFAREGSEVVLTRTEVGEIYEFGNLAYDCADAREYVKPRGTQRIALP
jgi:hypothetical protein